MPFQSRQFSPARITRMPSCPSTMAASAQLLVSDGAQSSHDINQQDCADGGHDKLADDPARIQTEQPEHGAAEHRADNAEQQIHEHAVAAAAHDLARQEAGENPDDDLPDQIHSFTTTDGCYCSCEVVVTGFFPLMYLSYHAK